MAAAGQHHLDRPESFWDIVLGSGYRATIDALSRDQRDQVRQRVLSQLRLHRSVELGLVPAGQRDLLDDGP